MNDDETVLVKTLEKLTLDWIEYTVQGETGGESSSQNTISIQYAESHELAERKNTHRLLAQAINKGLTNIEHQFDVAKIVDDLERILFDNFYYAFEAIYYTKICCLCQNFEKNALYLLSHYDPQLLCFFPSEALATGTALEEWRAKYRHMLSEKLQTQKKQNKGIFECPNCHLYNTDYYSLQTRGADEPATIFVQCFNCNKQFKR